MNSLPPDWIHCHAWPVHAVRRRLPHLLLPHGPPQLWGSGRIQEADHQSAGGRLHSYCSGGQQSGPGWPEGNDLQDLIISKNLLIQIASDLRQEYLPGIYWLASCRSPRRKGRPWHRRWGAPSLRHQPLFDTLLTTPSTCWWGRSGRSRRRLLEGRQSRESSLSLAGQGSRI